MPIENQLEYVRKELTDMPDKEKQQIADKAGLTMRTVFNVRDVKRHPRYESVFAIYCALKARRARKAKVPA